MICVCPWGLAYLLPWKSVVDALSWRKLGTFLTSRSEWLWWHCLCCGQAVKPSEANFIRKCTIKLRVCKDPQLASQPSLLCDPPSPLVTISLPLWFQHNINKTRRPLHLSQFLYFPPTSLSKMFHIFFSLNKLVECCQITYFMLDGM